MEMRTRILPKMLNSEVQEYLKRNDIIIVPVGTVEMHGGFPLDCETVISEAYALKMAEACDGLVLTGLPYFYAGATGSGRGTVQVSIRDGIDYLGAIARSLLRLGFKRQVYISFHGPAHMTVCPMVRDFYDETGVPILYMDSMMQMGKCQDLFKDFSVFHDITVGAYKIMNRIDDVPLVTGYSELKQQSCAPFNDLFGLGYQSAAIGYCFGENSDHMPTPDIPDIETRDRMAAIGEDAICKMVERMNMPHVVEQMQKLEAYGLENEEKYPWMPSAYNRKKKTIFRKGEMMMLKTITIPCGQIQGTECQWPGVTAYKGIRYATAGRWEYPVEVTKWDGVYDASEYGNCSYQPRAFYDEETVLEKVFYYYEFRKGASYTYSEDCLFLNVWVPEGATPDSKLPVLFYIHGGGYTGGCGHEKHFDGPVWASKGVVAVTCNYRLGPMGFMCLPELKERDGHTGNYGLYDQMMAMQWVQHNIAAFGGDPTNVTVMGQSAGAMSTMQHCISPKTHGLFNKAVMSSGGGAHKLMDSAQTYEDRYEFWQQVMADMGVSTLNELLSADVEKIFVSWQKLKKSNMKYGMVASPCIDGELLTKSPLTALNDGDVKDIPYMLGATSQDMMPFFIFPMAQDFCDKQKKAYCWFFDRQLPGDKNGAWHSSDLWYWFGTLKNGWRPFEEKDYALSDVMSSYLCNFVKTGNPNGEGLVEWKQAKSGQKEVIRLGEGKVRMGKVSKAKLLWTTITNKNVGE